MSPGSPRPTTILLCRHAQSQWNAAGLIQGQSPEAPGLSAHGREQARRLAQRLSAAEIVALYSSDLRRAAETAAIVGQALRLEPQHDPRWREVDLGRWQGLTGEQVAQRWPEEWARAYAGQDIARGGGETFAQAQARTLAAIRDIADRHAGQAVAVVSHGGNVRVSVAGAEAFAPGLVYHRINHIPNASVTVLEAGAGHLAVAMIADASHLDELPEVAEDETSRMAAR